jgi:hypothetical protein
MSGDSVVQWAQASLQAGVIVGSPQGVGLDLSQWHSTALLHAAYAGFCQQHKLRTVVTRVFGKRLTSMFGARVRESAGRRMFGYHVPDEDTLQKKLDASV